MSAGERTIDGDLEPRSVRWRRRVQFTSCAITDRATRSGLVPSMGSIGDCRDDAMIRIILGQSAYRPPRQEEAANTDRWATHPSVDHPQRADSLLLSQMPLSGL